MKIALMPNLTRKNALSVSLEVCAQLDKLNADYIVSTEQKEYFLNTSARFLSKEEMIEECDVIIAVGGDGTIIHAAKAGKPILGINAGRIAFMAYEAVTRRKPNAKVENTIHNIGFILLMGLFVVVLISDIIKCF